MKKLIISMAVMVAITSSQTQAEEIQNQDALRGTVEAQAAAALEGNGGLHMMVFHTDKSGNVQPLAILHDQENHPSHNEHAKATLLEWPTWGGVKQKASDFKESAKKVIKGGQERIRDTLDPPPGKPLERLNWSMNRAKGNIQEKWKIVKDNPKQLPAQVQKAAQDAFSHIKKYYISNN